MKEARCDNVKHFEIVDEVIEVKCRARFCGHGPGVVVIHKFDPKTGELLGTNSFRDPSMKKED